MGKKVARGPVNKSNEARAVQQAGLIIHGWVPVIVERTRLDYEIDRASATRQETLKVLETGKGVMHTGTRAVLFRDTRGYHMRAGQEEVEAHRLRVFDTTWAKISNGLFWTMLDWIKRKDCFQGDLPS